MILFLTSVLFTHILSKTSYVNEHINISYIPDTPTKTFFFTKFISERLAQCKAAKLVHVRNIK